MGKRLKPLSIEQRKEMDYRLGILRDSILEIEADLSQMYGHRHELVKLADNAAKEVSRLRYRYQDFLHLESPYLMPGDEIPNAREPYPWNTRFSAIWVEKKDAKRKEEKDE